MQAVKDQTRLRICADLSEPSLLTSGMSNRISYAGGNILTSPTESTLDGLCVLMLYFSNTVP